MVLAHLAPALEDEPRVFVGIDAGQDRPPQLPVVKRGLGNAHAHAGSRCRFRRVDDAVRDGLGHVQGRNVELVDHGDLAAAKAASRVGEAGP